jgi:iron complex transport system substrate-binding protein
VVAATALVIAQAPAAAPRRIVSLIPAVTEMLFAMGAGPQVVGVGSFDNYPPEAHTRARVGGLIDPHIERILSLRPDLVVVYSTQDDLESQMERARVPVFLYEHAGLPDVAATIRALGRRVGQEQRGAALATQIDEAIADIRRRVAGRTQPRTLLIFGRDDGRTLRGVYASGGRGFLHDMLVVAGGANVFADVDRQSVQATSELILARAPDVILEISATAATSSNSTERDLRAWDVLAAVPAVRNRRVHLLAGSEMVVPGPRLANAARRMAQALHPEAFK